MSSNAGRIEWRIKVDNGKGSSTEILTGEETRFRHRVLQCLITNKVSARAWRFLRNAWQMGADDPRKVYHCLKVGIALCIVSLFYYMRPLYDGVGGTAMWAVMTVIVVFEYTVGATICKSLNRIVGTFIAGCVAIGVHYLAHKSGEKLEPFVVGVSLFIFASGATFSRFIPGVKKRFDYGTMIFILTFSLVTISGFRVEKLLELARERSSTIVIGTSLCIFTSMLVFPVWAGQDLHCLIIKNMKKLADSLDGCVAEFLKVEGENANEIPNSSAYKCVLNSKATEEAMANFARWEPSHGNFSFRHPWKQYLKISAAMRSCAYSLETLNSFASNKNQGSELVKKQLDDVCRQVNSRASGILRELSANLEEMKKSTKLETSVQEMNMAVQELKNHLEFLPDLVLKTTPGNLDETKKLPDSIPLIQVIPLVTFASLLIEIPGRVEAIVAAVEELAKMAEFRAKKISLEMKDEGKNNNANEIEHEQRDDETMKTLQRV